MAEAFLGFYNGEASIFDQKKKPPGSGTHRSPDAASFDSISGALVPAAFIAAAYLTAFGIVRPWYPSQYAPRTFFRTIPEKDRTPSTSTSSTAWIRDFWHFDDNFILRHHSFDAYLFLRFFRVVILISFIGCCLTWPVLFPLNATGGGTAKQLDKIAFGNIADSKRLWGHTVVAFVFLSFILLLLTRERVFLIGLRQAYITTPLNTRRLSSRTVIFLAPPREVLEDGNLERLFNQSVKRSWKISDFKDLQSLTDKRNEKVFELELAELRLAQNVARQTRKGYGRPRATNGRQTDNGTNSEIDNSANQSSQSDQPLIGKKLDTIDQILHALPELEETLANARERYEKNQQKPTRALIVEFKDQLSAHQALQQVQHHSPLSLQPRFVNATPKDINWSNLTIEAAQRITYTYVAVAVFIATILLWSIPVGFVGTISNIDYLTNKIKWLRFVEKLPEPVLAFIKGFLPPYLLSLLVSYVPYWFRYVATTSGDPTVQEAERTTQNWYFVFQVLQVFLITTFSSGATTIVTRIANRPGSVPDLLARNLPKASNFYLTYFTLQGLSSSTSLLIKYTDVFQYLFWKHFWDKTPRQKYERETKTKGLFQGNQYPKFTNMAVIAITYSCIAPLVLGFATVGLTFFYITYRYLFLYANNAKLDTKGACYGRALQHMLTGVYLSELCLIGLFGARKAKGPSVFMGVFFIVTMLYHLTVNRYLGPLEKNMPLDVLQEAATAESAPLLSPAADDEVRSVAASTSSRLPSVLSTSPLSLILPSRLLPSPAQLRPYLTDPSAPPELPSYTESQLKSAYLPPALTSKTPVVWLPSDPNQICADLAVRNKELSQLETSVGPAGDGGCKIDAESGRLRMDGVLEDFSRAPIFKEPTLF